MLRITITGPQGSGKSRIARVLCAVAGAMGKSYVCEDGRVERNYLGRGGPDLVIVCKLPRKCK